MDTLLWMQTSDDIARDRKREEDFEFVLFAEQVV